MVVAKIFQLLRNLGRSGLNKKDFMACILLCRKQLHPNGTKPGKSRKIETCSTDELGQ